MSEDTIKNEDGNDLDDEKSFSSYVKRKVKGETIHERLALEPPLRIGLATTVAGVVGLLSGLKSGSRIGSLQYLAENAHRMPRTKGAWYFYHKRKNYVIMQKGVNFGIEKALKYGSITFAYFGIEAYLDDVRGVVDFANTMTAAGVVGIAYGTWMQMGIKRAFKFSKSFLIFGTLAGLMQDGIRYARGNDVWYLSKVRKNIVDGSTI